MLDVIVIGAGPGGASAAQAIAQAGWRVVLLEKDAYPGRCNVCGGGIEEADFDEMGVPDHLIHKRILRREHHFPWGTTTVANPHITVMRREFDRWLAEQAVAAGAELVNRARACAVRRESTGHVVVTVDQADAGEVTYRSPLVIFADGSNTLAPRSGNLGFVRAPTTAAIGLVHELNWPGTPRELHEIHFGPRVGPGGYIWIFPKRDCLNVGIMLPYSQGIGRQLASSLRAFIQNRPDLRALSLIRRAGACIPTTPARRIYDDSMMAVGDAAGLVDALTGAGIMNSVASGRLAGKVACEALELDDFSAEFLSRYQNRWKSTPRCQMIEFQSRLTRVLRPFSRFDGNLYAKAMQVLFLGKTLTRWQKLQLLAYPLLYPYRRKKAYRDSA